MQACARFGYRKKEFLPPPTSPHPYTPVVWAEDEKCTGFRHGHCLFLKVQLRQGPGAWPHRHLWLLLILLPWEEEKKLHSQQLCHPLPPLRPLPDTFY